MQRVAKTRGYAFIKEVSIALFLFDLLLIKNQNLLGVPLSERRRLLENCIKPLRLIRLSNYTVSSDIAGVERYFRQALGYGAEGVVIKSAAGPYQAGKRGWLWIKFKREYQEPLADTFDLVVVGAIRGKGHRAGSYGSLLLCHSMLLSDDIGLEKPGKASQQLLGNSCAHLGQEIISVRSRIEGSKQTYGSSRSRSLMSAEQSSPSARSIRWALPGKARRTCNSAFLDLSGFVTTKRASKRQLYERSMICIGWRHGNIRAGTCP